MSDKISADVRRFHALVEQGGIEALRAALAAGAPVNAPGHIGKTALMVAIEVQDLDKAKLLLEYGADPELTDDFNTTPLRTAVDVDFAPAVAWLLRLGVDRGYRPKYPLKPVDYSSYRMPTVPLPSEMKGILSEEEWQASQEQSRAAMREFGLHTAARPVISDVRSVAVLQLFLDAGDCLELAPSEVKRALLGLPSEAPFTASRAEYQAQKSPRFGTRNPEPMDLLFWRDMIRSGVNAYAARMHFQDTNPFETPGAVWCYSRFGASLTPLPDGRFVQIGGEHEDFYDPDFHIYNDVVIHDGRGGFRIYGYPSEVFPPTDFHTATLVGDQLYVVGGLGYVKQRVEGTTPVYRLQLETWEIEPLATSGANPGWIHDHRARYDSATHGLTVTGGKLHHTNGAGHADLLTNEDAFELDLATLQWRKMDKQTGVT